MAQIRHHQAETESSDTEPSDKLADQPSLGQVASGAPAAAWTPRAMSRFRIAAATLCASVHVLTISLIINALLAEPFTWRFMMWLPWHGSWLPWHVSWDAASVCGMTLLLCSLATMQVAPASIKSWSKAAWCIGTPFGLHLLLLPACPQGVARDQSLRDCILHTCGVSALLAVVAASEIGSEYTTVSTALLWQALLASTSCIIVGAALRAIQHTRDTDAPVAQYRTPMGVAVATLLQMCFAVGTISAVLSGLPRGVRYPPHLPLLPRSPP